MKKLELIITEHRKPEGCSHEKVFMSGVQVTNAVKNEAFVTLDYISCCFCHDTMTVQEGTTLTSTKYMYKEGKQYHHVYEMRRD